MENQFERTELLIGAAGIKKLADSTVAIFGVGGVGGFATEALARSGVGHLILVDADAVAVSNINRQIIATHATVGKNKVDVMKERILDINPACEVEAYPVFYSESSKASFDFSKYDYVIDAIDTLESKIDLILTAKAAATPIISSMGAGNKLNPTLFKVSDISKTSVCPLARAVRNRLKKAGVFKGLKVVYSEEAPVGKRESGTPVGSIAFVPSVAGLILAAEVVKDLTQNQAHSADCL